MLPGESRTFAIQVTVDSNLVAGTGGSDTLTNTATVTADQEDPNLGNNTASTSAFVNDEADLRLIKECKPDRPVKSGDKATCTIIVDNLGPSAARDVVVTDTHLSEGSFKFISAIVSPSGTCNITGGNVTCSIGTVPTNERAIITVKITAKKQVDVNDIASVTSSTPDPNYSNNTDRDSLQLDDWKK